MDASHIFPQSMLTVILLIGGVIGVVVSRVCFECWMGLFFGSHGPIVGKVFSPFVELEALRVRFDQAPLSLSACRVPREVIAEGCEVSVVTENLFATCIGVHSSTQMQPKVMSLFLLCLYQTYCKVVV